MAADVIRSSFDAFAPGESRAHPTRHEKHATSARWSMEQRILRSPRRDWRRSGASTLLLVSATLGLVACGASEPGSSPTLANRAEPSASLSLVNPLLDYQLSEDKLNRLYLAHHALYRLSRRNPAPLDRLQEALNELPPEAVDLMVAAVDEEPVVRETFRQSGIAPSDFFLTQYNLVSAVMVLEARAKGRSDDLPEVSEANIEFVRLNPQLVRRLMTERKPPGS
jgi:hypothetical protein